MPDLAALEALKHGIPEAPVHDLILSRWSPRSFSTRIVTDEDLKSIFAAAAWAPNSYNEQPWRFIVGRLGDETYTKILNALAPPNQSWAKSAPVLFCTFGKKTFTANGQPNGFSLHDTGAATTLAVLQAETLGLHAHGMGGFDKDLIRASFGVPSDFEVGACWALGYLGDPDATPENFRDMEKAPRSRKKLAEYVFADWDKAATL